LKEKLIIKNFGPINSVELDLKRFNVLIGENGTGKSTVAKVLASIYNLFNAIEEEHSSLLTDSIFASIPHFKKHLSIFSIDEYLTTKSVIKLDRNDVWQGKNVFFYLEQEKITTNMPEHYKKTSYHLNNSITYIPADRIATSLFSSATWPGLIDVEEGRIDMPKYFLRFINLFERLKKTRDEFDFTEILGIKFRQDDGIDKIILKDGTVIGINESASAIQSNLSLFVIIAHQAENNGTEKTFIIEEPELNLFPVAQNKLMHYLVDKTMNYGNNILLTTHSPYSLTSINNLIYAYDVGQTHEEEVKQIIDKKYWLNPADVSAYRLMEDGTAKNILDEEMKLMEAGELDEISRSLNEIFDKIANIEYSTVDEN
jgi:predicted ATPase